MKKPRLAKKFLEELEKLPIVSVACERVGLSRQTIYRWIKEDSYFKMEYEDAMIMGINAVTDLAESKLFSNINKGDQRAIEYFLNRRKRDYIQPKPITINPEPEYKGVTTFTIVRPPTKEVLDKMIDDRLIERGLPSLPLDKNNENGKI